MKKFTFALFVVVFGFLFLNINYSLASISNCSSISGYKLIKEQSCETTINTSNVFSFKASDPEGNNLSWSINWGDNQGTINKICPSSKANKNFSVNHIWTKAGTYKVKLNVSDCKDGDAEASFNVIVKPLITIPIATTHTKTITPVVAEEEVPVLNPSAGKTDIVILPQNWPEKFLWKNAIQLPLKIKIEGTRIPYFSYGVSFLKTQYVSPPISKTGWLSVGEHTYTIGFSTRECGLHNIKIVINPDKAIPEKDYSNNTLEKTINVDCTTPPYDFDMTIEKVGTWPTTAVQGKWITLNAKYYNKGTEYNTQFSYWGYVSKEDPKKMEEGNGPLCFFRTDSTGTHKIMCPQGLETPFHLMDQPVCGNNHYSLKVDPYNNALETKEDNNEISGDVFVDCSKKPDLIIQKLGVWPSTAKNGQNLIMNFIMKNIGDGPASNGVIRMCVGSRYQGGYWPNALLNPNTGTQTYTFGTNTNNWKPECVKGQKLTLYVAADNAMCWGSSEIQESNENNNVLTHEITCE